MAEEQEKPEWLDFSEIRKNSDVELVLKELELFEGLKLHGDEFSGWCPLGTKRHGKRDSFSINQVKKTYQCFACKGRGTILDFVGHMKGLHIRESAIFLRDLNTPTHEDDGHDGHDELGKDDGVWFGKDEGMQVTERLKAIREDVEELRKSLNWTLDNVLTNCDAIARKLHATAYQK